MSRGRAVPVLIAAVFACAGCGGDDKEAEPAPAAAAATPSAAATEAASAEPAGAGGKVTPLGTKLKVGETAVIDYEDASTHGKSIIEFTPKKIEKGSLEDFANIDLDADQKKSTPYYAEITVKNVGKGDLSGGDPATYVNGVDDRGQDQNELIFIGGFDRCNHETPKKLKPGDSYDSCLVYLIPGGGAITGFHWIQFDEKSGKSDLKWEQ
jgi:hypothetical protein